MNLDDPAGDALLVSCRKVARLLSLYASTIGKLEATSRIPTLTRVLGRSMWRLAEFGAWVNAGYPVRDHWELVQPESVQNGAGIPHTAEHLLQDRLLVRAPAAAAVVGISLRDFANANARGYPPSAVRLGGARLWRPDELRPWVERDYPARGVWEVSRDVKWRAYPLCAGRPFPPEHDLRGEGPPWLFPNQTGGRRWSRAGRARVVASDLLAKRSK